MKNKIIYPCKIPCEMYIRIFIAERLSVFSFFFKLLLFCRHLGVCFSFRSFYQHQLARRNLKIIIHSCLEKLGMYGVTWFPLKSYIRTKSKWVKKKRIDTNQTKRIKSKKKVSVHPDVELEKTSSWIRLQSLFLFFISFQFTFDVFECFIILIFISS